MNKKHIFISYEETTPQIVAFRLAYEELPSPSGVSISKIPKH